MTSDRERFRRDLLDLIMRPGVVEIIVALHERDGSASLAELQAAGIPKPAPLLRSLAAAGQVSRSDAGTWDTTPSLDTRFALTPAGTGLAHTLGEIEYSANCFCLIRTADQARAEGPAEPRRTGKRLTIICASEVEFAFDHWGRDARARGR